MTFTRTLLGALLLVAVGCSTQDKPSAKSQLIANMKRATDHHSFSKPEEAVTTHLDWNAKVDFDTRQITATATYDIATSADAERILLDCRDLDIHSVAVDGAEVAYELGTERPFLGQPLSVPVSPSSKKSASPTPRRRTLAPFSGLKENGLFSSPKAKPSSHAHGCLAKTARGFASRTKPTSRSLLN